METKIKVVDIISAVNSNGKGLNKLSINCLVDLKDQLFEQTKDYGVSFEDEYLIDLMLLYDSKEKIITFTKTYSLSKDLIFIINLIDLSSIYYDKELKTKKAKDEELLKKVIYLATKNAHIRAKVYNMFQFSNINETSKVINDFVVFALPFFKKQYKNMF